MTTTTIKVPSALRDRVQHYAKARGQTQAMVLGDALALLDRQAFFDRLRVDLAARPESDTDRAERNAWLAGTVASGEAEYGTLGGTSSGAK